MSQFRRLDPDRIIHTLERLVRRIRQRFPHAGLGNVCAELLEVARDTAQRSAAIRKPHWPARVLVVVVVLVIADLVYLFGPRSVQQRVVQGSTDMVELITTLEAFLGSCFFLGAAIVFLVSMENRIKRRRATDAVFEMRAMAHIVDMHQLTKDPERVLRPGHDTVDSPVRPMSRFELSRYLDYCSEMLSLMGKIAALYVQDYSDPLATQAVDEVEQLTTSLSRKIWQKIMVLDQVSGTGMLPSSSGSGDYPITDPSLADPTPPPYGTPLDDGGPVA